MRAIKSLCREAGVMRVQGDIASSAALYLSCAKSALLSRHKHAAIVAANAARQCRITCGMRQTLRGKVLDRSQLAMLAEIKTALLALGF